jgi:glycosyltransferase involved in cell wall biosynthesis
MPHRDKINVAVVYHIFPHYRRAVLDEMVSDCDIRYYFVSDIVDDNKDIVSCNMFSYANYRYVKNIWILGHFLWQKKIFRVLNSIENLDAIIFLGDWKYLSTWLASIYYRLNGVRCYYWSHGILPNVGKMELFFKKYYFGKIFNAGFVYGQTSKKLMINNGLAFGDVVVVYNSLVRKAALLEHTSQNSVQIIFNIAVTGYFIYSGRLKKGRNILLLIDAISEVNRLMAPQSIGLIVLGDGEMRDELCKYIVEKKMSDNVALIGSCYDDNIIAELYSKAHASVFPGAIGLSGIQSLVYGVPVITDNDYYAHKPEAEAVVENMTGFYYKKNDLNSLVEKMLVCCKLTSSERSRMSQECYAMINNFYNAENQVAIINKKIFDDRKADL